MQCDSISHKQTIIIDNGTADVMINVLDFIHFPLFTERALTLRFKTEKHRIHQLHCPAPRGLNIFN